MSGPTTQSSIFKVVLRSAVIRIICRSELTKFRCGLKIKFDREVCQDVPAACTLMTRWNEHTETREASARGDHVGPEELQCLKKVFKKKQFIVADHVSKRSSQFERVKLDNFQTRVQCQKLLTRPALRLWCVKVHSSLLQFISLDNHVSASSLEQGRQHQPHQSVQRLVLEVSNPWIFARSSTQERST
jgi:hypothetical protein